MPKPALEPPLEPIAIDRLRLQPGWVVADFGVGANANWAVRMAQQVGHDGQVLMFDVRKAALAAALSAAKLSQVKNCRAVWSNLEIFKGALGVSDGVFDAGIIVNMLNETKHPKDVLAEIHRMMKAGSQLLIIDWDPDTAHPLAPKPERRLAADYVAMLSKSVGFAPVERFTPGVSYWGMMVTKT